MRATELLGCDVYDADGERIGAVHDLSFELTWKRDGVASCRLVGLDCSDVSSVGHRLGYGRGDMAGPWPLDRLFTRRLERGRVEVAWSDVARFERPRVELRRRRAEIMEKVKRR